MTQAEMFITEVTGVGIEAKAQARASFKESGIPAVAVTQTLQEVSPGSSHYCGIALPAGQVTQF